MKRHTTLPLAALLTALPCSAQLAGRTAPEGTTPDPTGDMVAMQWGDYDGDGLDDALSIDSTGAVSLLRSAGAGALEDVTARAGLDALTGVRFALWQDFDADGQTDLFLGTRRGPAHLLQNQNGVFVDVTEQSGIATPGAHRAAHWVDYDGDRQLDLHLIADGENVLYHALGQGVFEPIVLAAPAPAAAPGARLLEGARETGVSAAATTGADTNRDSTPNPIDIGPGGADRTIVPSGTSKASLGSFSCVSSLQDMGGGGCIAASSTPALGMLYPMSENLNVDAATGNVGIGTTSPGKPLDVDGDVRFGPRVDIVREGGAAGGWRAFGTSSNKLVFQEIVTGEHALTLTDESRVGIGTTSPGAQLHVSAGFSGATPSANANIVVEEAGGASNYIQMLNEQEINTGQGLVFGNAAQTFSGGIFYAPQSGVPNFMTFRNSGNQTRMTIGPDGNVGIGTTTPVAPLTVSNGSAGLTPSSSTRIALETPGSSGNYVEFLSGTDRLQGLQFSNSAGLSIGSVLFGRIATGGSPDNLVLSTSGSRRILIDGNGNVGIGTDNPTEKLDVDGNAIVDVLTIRGGADLVEGFDSANGEVLEPGTVVVIDPENAGALMSSTEAYDFKVAGVVSGAGGVDAGLHLGQDGVLDGDTKVAMTGRVYVKCSAENGAIRPGDRLTTADLAGHAMRASDALRSDGSVIGKAMSSLDEGTGLVLVLVNLQ